MSAIAAAGDRERTHHLGWILPCVAHHVCVLDAGGKVFCFGAK